MSDAIHSAKAGGLAIKQNALRDAFSLDGVRCFLLKRTGQSGTKYTNLLELTSGWRIKFDDNRAESGLFRYAVVDIDAVRDIWAETSHIGYGVPNSSGEVEVYNFADGEKDRIDPDGSSVYFAGRVIRQPAERLALVADILFSGAGTADANAIYRYRGIYDTKNYYVRLGKPDLGAFGAYSVNWNSGLSQWQQWDESANQSWYRNPNDATLPQNGGLWEVDESGVDPPPSVTTVPF
jgi:hypothetical protein